MIYVTCFWHISRQQRQIHNKNRYIKQNPRNIKRTQYSIVQDIKKCPNKYVVSFFSILWAFWTMWRFCPGTLCSGEFCPFPVRCSLMNPCYMYCKWSRVIINHFQISYSCAWKSYKHFVHCIHYAHNRRGCTHSAPSSFLFSGLWINPSKIHRI